MNPYKLVGMYKAAIDSGEGLPRYRRELFASLGFQKGDYGWNVGAKPAFKGSDFNLAEVNRAFLGGPAFSELQGGLGALAQEGNFLAQEAGGAITSDIMGPLSASLATVQGLLGAEIVSGYNSPRFIGRSLVTWKGNIHHEEVKQRKYAPPKLAFTDLKDNQERPSGDLNASWTRARPLSEQAQKLGVSWRCLWFSVDAEEITAAVKEMGFQAGWVVEEDILNVAFGLKGTYRFGRTDEGDTETTYQTYLTAAAGGPYVNMLLANPLTNDANVDAANVALHAMRDPITGKPIDIPTTKMLVVGPLLERSANSLAHNNERWVGPDSAQERYVTPLGVATGASVYMSARAVDLQKALPFQGAMLAAGVPDRRWLWGYPPASFWYREAAPFTPVVMTASENPWLLLNGTMLMTTYNQMGSTSVIDPRGVVLNDGGAS